MLGIFFFFFFTHELSSQRTETCRTAGGRRANWGQPDSKTPPRTKGQQIPTAGDLFPPATKSGGADRVRAGRDPGGVLAGRVCGTSGEPGRRAGPGGEPGRRAGPAGSRRRAESRGDGRRARSRARSWAGGRRRSKTAPDGRSGPGGWKLPRQDRRRANGRRDEAGREPARKRQRRRPGAAVLETEAGDGGGCERSKTYCSDTMLGIDSLYSLGAKGHNI
jgi:hypothetical protein